MWTCSFVFGLLAWDNLPSRLVASSLILIWHLTDIKKRAMGRSIEWFAFTTDISICEIVQVTLSVHSACSVFQPNSRYVNAPRPILTSDPQPWTLPPRPHGKLCPQELQPLPYSTLRTSTSTYFNPKPFNFDLLQPPTQPSPKPFTQFPSPHSTWSNLTHGSAVHIVWLVFR